MTKYRVQKISDWGQVSAEILDFVIESFGTLAKTYDGWFKDWRRFRFRQYVEDGNIWFCFYGDKPVGMLMARLYGSTFDPRTKILMQDLLYVRPGNSRAVYLLLQHFIDFGKFHANHTFTMISEHTNIKGRSLERLGFRKTEEHYVLTEMKNG
jgi:hypothetical protein